MASGVLNIKKFDPSAMKQWRTIIFVGKRGSGKSVLMKDVISHLKKVRENARAANKGSPQLFDLVLLPLSPLPFLILLRQHVDFGLAMSPTEESASLFRSILPPTSVYDGAAAHARPPFRPSYSHQPTRATDYNSEALEKTISFQRSYIRKNKGKKHYHVMLLMDDCMYDKSVMKGKAIRDLFMNGRHLKITYCNALQYCMDMGPDLRSNTDYVFCLRENIIENRQRLYKYFFGMFGTYDEFARVMDNCTENHECIVLDNTSGSNKVEECVFWYKATHPVPDFKLGRRTFHKLSHMYRKTDEELEAEERMRELGSGADQHKLKGVRVFKKDVDGGDLQ